MSISFEPMTPADADEVMAFLSSNRFPFHVQAAPETPNVRQGIENGRFWNADTQGYWVLSEGIRIGLASLEDLQDAGSPLFDLRLGEAHRGKGIGVEVLRALCNLVFTTMPEVRRFEGQTREDNIAMRKTFIRAGFLKEAHYRLAWPNNDGGYVASIAYAILRQDWENGTVTEFDWDDILI
ncbi:Protein N-acetyltransferase, RimJ/RimL family [Arthrobacter alpinus]|uniref:Protein N-acetyltransferase, RimJ/RimL family n=1 Tax=Arthrobacter alpinus TaxID=656366 RepID=A0A1H5M794_9MICC|nr:GNAT family protein [Arthrobacter alpinus]SEE84238.1 Protein N-acetyltransferase, RimJ/RimL family [Arthrobacter alpinus]